MADGSRPNKISYYVTALTNTDTPRYSKVTIEKTLI